MKPPFTLHDARYPEDVESLRAVREPVFVIEQHCPLDEEWDDLDPQSRHVLAIDAEGRPIGTGRLAPHYRIGRMAVLAPARGSGVGAAILQHLIELARQSGVPEVTLSAQTHAIGFYERAGFVAEGEEYLDANIPHRLMRLNLSLAHGPIAFERAEQARSAACAIAAAARHQLWLVSPDLEPAIYDDEAFVAAVKRVARSGRGAAVRLLIGDIRIALQNGHRLLELAQRLPSLIEVRRQRPEESGPMDSALLFNDNGGWMRRADPASFDGEGHHQDAPRTRQLLTAFQRAWDRAEPETRLRVLKI